MSALLSDMTTKISDAQTQTAAAVALVAPLKPDQGDAATIAANKAAFATAPPTSKCPRRFWQRPHRRRQMSKRWKRSSRQQRNKNHKSKFQKQLQNRTFFCADF